MVNCIDNEKLLKNIIKQFCDQNFKFTLNLKILGSIHVQVDNNEVLTCFFDEKFFKSSQSRSLITTNQNLFNSMNVVKPLSENNAALNLVTTLNQLQQHQQQQQNLKLVNPSHLIPPNVNTQSLSSSSSSCSKSSTSSASSFYSGDSKQHKRKRSNAQNSDDGSSSASCNSRKEPINTDDEEEEEDDVNSSDHNLNENNENENEDKLNTSSANETPVKRTKRDEAETHDEAAAAAASALSLISAAAVASKLYNQQNIQPNPPHHNFHSIAANLNPYQVYNTNVNNENEQPGTSSVASSSSVVTISNSAQNISQKPLKPKTRYLMNDYEQQLKQQIFQQSIENQHNFSDQQMHQPTPVKSEHQIESEFNRTDGIKNEDHDSSLEESQLYMDEDNMNKNDKENEEQKPQINGHYQDNQSSTLQMQQQQHLMMAAAAAAMMNNGGVKQPINCVTDNSNLKLFMPHGLALNLAAVKQQPQQQQQQQQQNIQIQNGEKSSKKKSNKNSGTSSNLMSPSSANLIPSNGPNSNKSTDSSSSSSSTCSIKQNNKKSRQTIAVLAAAAAAAAASSTHPPGVNLSVNPLAPSNQNVDAQKNLAALASQYGLKDTSNIDQTINEVTEKSKISVNSPKPNSMKHLKKQHLLSASVQNHQLNIKPSPVAAPKKEKTKKSKLTEQVNPAQNGLGNVGVHNLIPNGLVNSVPSPNSISIAASQQVQNPVQAAAVAAAAALQYHQYLNNNLNKNVTPSQNQNSKNYHLNNGGAYSEETENHHKVSIKYEDANEEEPSDESEMREGQNGHMNGPLSIKSLAGPLTQSNTNTQPPQGPNGSNLEFECSACDKKFKYYCYYKRHMDACHSDIPKYVCDTCNKSYKWEASFRQHLRSHHNITEPGSHPSSEDNGEHKYDDGDENQNNQNDSSDEMKENGRKHEDEDDEEDDEEDPDVGTNDQMHHQMNNENRNLYFERDHEQMGAAGTLASIAESINAMHGRMLINNHNMS